MTLQVPNSKAPVVEVRDNKNNVIGYGFIQFPWTQFFQQYVGMPPAVVDVDADGSPFSYTPNANGILVITGGTITVRALTRGRTVLNVGTANIIPIRIGDTVTLTYSVKPDIKFLPD